MADPLGTVEGFFSSILQDPVYLLLTVGAICFFILLLVDYRIHKMHSPEHFDYQTSYAQWKGRYTATSSYPHRRSETARRVELSIALDSEFFTQDVNFGGT